MWKGSCSTSVADFPPRVKSYTFMFFHHFFAKKDNFCDPCLLPSRQKGEWVKCVTRTRVGKPALGFYELLKNIFSSKTNAV